MLEMIKTPCIGVCSTGIGDAVCRGCKRFSHEVVNWNGYSFEQKKLIDDRLSHFLQQIVETKLRVVDPKKLKWHLNMQQIDHPEHKSPSLWAYELLRAGASQIADLSDYGVELHRESLDTPLIDLRRIIDQEFYILSEAHYQRYFAHPISYSEQLG